MTRRRLTPTGPLVDVPPGCHLSPEQVSHILEDVAAAERVIAAYTHATASWDDLFYHCSLLHHHLRVLLAYSGAVPAAPEAPQPPDPDAVPDPVGD